MRKTIAIVGSHPRTREQFDFDRQDCDVWVFNEAMNQGWVKRADAVFQLHREEIWRNPENRNDPKHAEWLKSGNTPPIIMQAVYPDVPMSEAYPLEEICAKYLSGLTVSDGSKRYFTSSIAYAIALAIYRGYARIELYGVEMETNTEYQYQRDGVTFWIGIAIGNGVQCDVHSSMFDAPLYGYEGEAYLDYQVFVDRAAEIEAEIPPVKAIYEAAQKVATEAYAHYQVTGQQPEAVVNTMMAQIDAGHKLARYEGALQEVRRYMAKADTMKAETGGNFLFSRQEFEQSAQMLTKRRENAVALANTAAGACQVSFQEAIKHNNGMRRRKALQEFGKIAGQYIQHSIHVGLFTGAYQENLTIIQTLDKYIRAAGGYKAEEVLLAAAAAGG